MKARLPALCALLIAGSAFADPYVIAKQRARDAAQQNNNEQSRIQKAAADPAPAPMDPALQATLQNIGDLQANFAAIVNSDGAPDPAQKTSLLNNLSQAGQGAKASAASVKKLGADLASALAQRKKITAAQQKKLAAEVHALFNSSHLSAAQQKTMAEDVQKVLAGAGVSQDDIDSVVADLKKIADETK